DRKKVVKSEVSLRLLISIKWPAPTKVSQGTNEAFSTGSHAQKPPKLRASYAQAPPIRMPRPKMPIPKKVHGRAGSIHSFTRLVQRPAMAKANGTNVEAKPRKRVGGWITIQ